MERILAINEYFSLCMSRTIKRITRRRSISDDDACSALGFFVTPHFSSFEEEQRLARHLVPQFLSISEQGKDLKEGTWGNLDGSLSFLQDQNQDGVYILCSSNGFLLCCSNKQGSNDYIVCNPVTREFRNLPARPRTSFKYFAFALICNCDDPIPSSMSLDEVHFEVLRAGLPSNLGRNGALVFDSYSSVTNSWTQTSLVSDLARSFPHVPDSFLTFMVGGVIYWSINGGRLGLLVYDRANQRLERIKPPGDGRQGSKFPACFKEKKRNPYRQDYYGLCGGRVQYARHDFENYEIWVLKTDQRRGSASAKWVLKHRVNFNEMRRHNPNICITEREPFVSEFTDRIAIESFHPHNSGLVLVTVFEKPYWYNMATKKLTQLAGFTKHDHWNKYLLYEWPLSL